MTTKIHKMGNSLGIYIPKKIADAVNIQKGEPVSITTSSRNIIITPFEKKEKLEDLLSGIKDSNKHGHIDFGQNVGREIF